MSGEDNNKSDDIKKALGDGPDATAVLNIGQLGQILNIRESTETPSRPAMNDFSREPSVEAVLGSSGYTAYRALDAERREIAGMLDGEFWQLPEGESFSVGIITFDPATVDFLKRTSAADARYEIFARAMNGQETSLEQISQIVDIVDNYNNQYGPRMSPPVPPAPPTVEPLPPAPPVPTPELVEPLSELSETRTGNYMSGSVDNGYAQANYRNGVGVSASGRPLDRDHHSEVTNSDGGKHITSAVGHVSHNGGHYNVQVTQFEDGMTYVEHAPAATPYIRTAMLTGPGTPVELQSMSAEMKALADAAVSRNGDGGTALTYEEAKGILVEGLSSPARPVSQPQEPEVPGARR